MREVGDGECFSSLRGEVGRVVGGAGTEVVKSFGRGGGEEGWRGRWEEGGGETDKVGFVERVTEGSLAMVEGAGDGSESASMGEQRARVTWRLSERSLREKTRVATPMNSPDDAVLVHDTVLVSSTLTMLVVVIST